MGKKRTAVGCVYRIRCLANSKQYVGSTSNYRRRCSQHRQALRAGKHHSRKLQAAWNKYGEAAFVFEQIESVYHEDDLFKREQFHLDKCGTLNCCAVAGGSPLRGKKHSAKTKVKLKAAWRRRKARGLTYKHSDETKEKIRLAHLGIKPNMTSRIKMAASARKRPAVSAETREKLSLSSLGNTYAAGNGHKVSAALRGRRLSISHRANISKAIKAAYAEGRL